MKIKNNTIGTIYSGKYLSNIVILYSLKCLISNDIKDIRNNIPKTAAKNLFI